MPRCRPPASLLACAMCCDSATPDSWSLPPCAALRLCAPAPTQEIVDRRRSRTGGKSVTPSARESASRAALAAHCCKSEVNGALSLLRHACYAVFAYASSQLPRARHVSSCFHPFAPPSSKFVRGYLLQCCAMRCAMRHSASSRRRRTSSGYSSYTLPLGHSPSPSPVLSTSASALPLPPRA